MIHLPVVKCHPRSAPTPSNVAREVSAPMVCVRPSAPRPRRTACLMKSARKAFARGYAVATSSVAAMTKSALIVCVSRGVSLITSAPTAQFASTTDAKILARTDPHVENVPLVKQLLIKFNVPVLRELVEIHCPAAFQII